MDFTYQHGQSQRILRQRNLLGISVLVLAAVIGVMLLVSATRPREIVLQPVLRSPLTLSSAGASREYLELVTRDTAVLILDRSPSNLDYWMNTVLALTSERAHGKIKADLLKVVDEQRSSSIAQFFTLQSMTIDPKNLRSTVTGQLHTIVGQKVISKDTRTFQFDWEYNGVSLKLAGFGMVADEAKTRKALS
ncbi:type IV conjugative transfer system protein TraE [Sphingomonas xinjiangensis]|uniref:Conjugal transfer pilus assembly protein TraE n=1 Tax=Sphingomonas xinjiangensis TaxID=643568 RepID=A0A840YLT8_9SPHN|nr:type IV conjugative transfer system protein TraE [Sphingomonas xinjiangensis]MBB5712358.1 conjugal transfer pilus assembly protein TraE [Sphingomonas xinjiangensis]